jgi:hypothetical protein
MTKLILSALVALATFVAVEARAYNMTVGDMAKATATTFYIPGPGSPAITNVQWSANPHDAVSLMAASGDTVKVQAMKSGMVTISAIVYIADGRYRQAGNQINISSGNVGTPAPEATRTPTPRNFGAAVILDPIP